MTLVLLVLAAATPPLTFDGGKPGQPPAGFEFTTTKNAPAAKWIHQRDGKGMVLAQVENKNKERFACAITKAPPLKDVRLVVKIKTISGYQGAGVVWGYRDADNYFVARTNPDEGNVRVDQVVAGVRKKLGSKPVDGLATGKWHTFAAHHQGTTIALTLGDQKVVEVKDAPATESGRVGLWIKDDTVAHFDDFVAEGLAP